MMFRCDDDVFHSGFLRELRPGVRMIIGWIKLLRESAILSHGNFRVTHDPFTNAFDLLVVICAGGNGVYTPMNEHPELGVPPPFHPRVVLLGRFVSKSQTCSETKK